MDRVWLPQIHLFVPRRGKIRVNPTTWRSARAAESRAERVTKGKGISIRGRAMSQLSEDDFSDLPIESWDDDSASVTPDQIRVLVVDDDPLMRRLLQRAL